MRERHYLRVDSPVCPVYVKAAVCDMLSAVKPIGIVRELEINAFGDGLFHLGTYSFIVAGLGLLLRRLHQQHRPVPTVTLIGGLLPG
jgi:uncharacterized membrane protein